MATESFDAAWLFGRPFGHMENTGEEDVYLHPSAERGARGPQLCQASSAEHFGSRAQAKSTETLACSLARSNLGLQLCAQLTLLSTQSVRGWYLSELFEIW